MKNIERAISWYFSRRTLPYWSILMLDCLFVITADFVVTAFSYGAANTLQIFVPLLLTFLFYLIFYLIGFRIFHTYAGVMRFSSFVDLRKVGFAMLFGLCCCMLFQGIVRPSWLRFIPYPIMVLQALAATIMMWVVRIWVKTLYDDSLKRRSNIRTYIYGVKEGGIALAKNINSQESSPYMVCGFISDDSSIAAHRLMGKPVLFNDEHLVDHLLDRGVQALIVSPKMAGNLRNNERMVNDLISSGIKIMLVQSEKEWDGKTDMNMSRLREVNVEDLLPRKKIEVDMEAIGAMLKGKRILITGAAGSIGSEMVRQIAPYSPGELILLDQAETPLHDIRLMMKKNWPEINARILIGDITNAYRMEEIFRDTRPEYVFHAAAYKHVPMMEDNPAESVSNNVNGTIILADLALRYGTRKFVMVSTDKAVNPTNVMGCSKRLCEIYVQSLDKAVSDKKVEGSTRFVTTRFGNVLGSNGSVIPLFEKQIKAGGPVTVTHPDIIRFFMLIPEACKLVLEAGTMGNGGEIFVFDMGEPVKIADLARRMIDLSGAKDVEIKFTGLREGEKLYEEVLNDKEVTLPTFHDKIKIAKVREYDYAEVRTVMDQLVKLAETGTDMEIVAKMKEIVPEFKSKNSKYESLD